MDSKEEKLKEALLPVVEHLKERLGDELMALVLFGSRARDDERETSDWDIFLLARSLPSSPVERYARVRACCPVEPEGGLSFLSKTQEEFESEFPSFYLDLAIDGIILLDTAGYMDRQLNRIRELIGQAGLRRERIPGGFFWEWQQPPGPDWEITWAGFRHAGSCG